MTYSIIHNKIRRELEFKFELILFFSVIVLLLLFVTSTISATLLFITLFLILIIFWKNTNNFIGFIFPKFITNSNFYKLSLLCEDKITKIPYENIVELPIRDYIKDNVNSDRKRKFIIGCTVDNDKKLLAKIMELIDLENIFSDEHMITVHFIISLLIINILYTIMMVLTYSQIEVWHFSKELMIIVTSICFTITLIMFTLFTTPVSEILLEYRNKNEVIFELEDKIEIWEYFNEQIENISVAEIADSLFSIQNKLNNQKAQIMQVSTPILYLTHITILMSYFKC